MLGIPGVQAYVLELGIFLIFVSIYYHHDYLPR